MVVDYGSFMPEALKASDNPTLNTLGRKLYLQKDWELSDPFNLTMQKVLEGTHFTLISNDYLLYTIRSKGITQFTYIMNQKVDMNVHSRIYILNIILIIITILLKYNITIVIITLTLKNHHCCCVVLLSP